MHERKSTAKSYALLSDDEHLNERCAKRRSDEAQTPSPQHVRAQLFVPHGDERERFCSAMMIFWWMF
jgi:hypothetical protein